MKSEGDSWNWAELCSWDGVSAQTAASTPTYAHRACWVSQSGTETEEFAGRRAAQRPRGVAQAIAWGRLGKRRTIRSGALSGRAPAGIDSGQTYWRSASCGLPSCGVPCGGPCRAGAGARP